MAQSGTDGGCEHQPRTVRTFSSFLLLARQGREELLDVEELRSELEHLVVGLTELLPVLLQEISGTLIEPVDEKRVEPLEILQAPYLPFWCEQAVEPLEGRRSYVCHRGEGLGGRTLQSGMVSFAKFDQTGYRTPISAARRQKIAARNHVIVCTSGNNLVKAGGERNRNAVAQKLRTSVTSR
jgi:hypothetical protein